MSSAHCLGSGWRNIALRIYSDIKKATTTVLVVVMLIKYCAAGDFA